MTEYPPYFPFKPEYNDFPYPHSDIGRGTLRRRGAVETEQTLFFRKKYIIRAGEVLMWKILVHVPHEERCNETELGVLTETVQEYSG